MNANASAQANLPAPQAAWAAWYDALAAAQRGDLKADEAEDALRVAVGSVAAAELRRLADDLMRADPLKFIAAEALLRHRATELDGAGATRQDGDQQQ